MDDVARLPAADRADLFVVVGTASVLSSEIIEKDFWVCWTLKRLFTLTDPPAGLLFKGGTSLSKVFGIIERFSEDVDLSFDRAGLGIVGNSDPLNAPSGKQRKRGIDALAEACRQVIRERLLPQLSDVFTDALGEPASASSWGLEVADDDPDGQTLLFRYPQAVRSNRADGPAYIRPVVRLEIGARSDHWPAVDAMVMPYAATEFPRMFKESACRVRALAAERTFWEKATLLHMWHYAPESKKFSDRLSRHSYDIVRMYQHQVGKAAVKDVDLLLKVAQHKSVFFQASWARYGEAKPGTLPLVPRASRLRELEQDYRKMQEMIFGHPPTFDEIVAVLREIECDVNGA